MFTLGMWMMVCPHISYLSCFGLMLLLNRAYMFSLSLLFRSVIFKLLMMMILGVSPLRGFPVERRGIGHLVPILCGRRLAGLVRLGGGEVCPSAGCPVGTVVQLVGPAPTLHGALGGRRASAGYGPASGASVSAQPSAGRTKAGWPHRDTTSR